MSFVSALDLRTFVLINSVMACLMALVLFSQNHNYPASVRGMRHWAFGQLLAFVAAILFALHGKIPLFMTAGLANVLLVGVAAVLLSGSSQHFGRSVPRRLFTILLLIEVPLFAWLSSDFQLYLYRLLAVCVSMFILLLWQAKVIWQFGNGKFAARFTVTVLVSMAIVMALRGITAVATPPVMGVFVTTAVQTLYIASLSFGLLLLSIGGILMASERLHLELELLASKDSLTGAFTRRALFELGDNEVARANRQTTPLCVLMLDLDHFKAVNDNYGHLVGDQVLGNFAQRVQDVLRRPAVLGRYGGEEFLVLLPDTQRDEALRVAERIRASKTSLPQVPECTVSIGLASFVHGGQDSLRDLISRADAALYRAKELGRNRVEEASV